MSDSFEQKTTEPEFPNRLVYFLALTFVALGIINSTPLIPGWDEMWRGITGIEKLKIRTFPTEWFYPLIFSLMMLLVALQHSMWRSWKGTNKAIFGVFILAMIGTLFQHIVGGIVFVTTLGIYLESINPDAFPGIWKTIFYVYPIERVAIAVISAVVAAPIIRSIKPLLSKSG